MPDELFIRGGMRTREAHCDECKPRSSPISRLPTELLTTVFAMLANLEERRMDIDMDVLLKRRTNIQTYMKWVKLMLVCRHWCDVGCSSPRLWRRISITKNPESLQYRLSQTVGCTIDIFFSEDASTNECAMRLLLPFAPHVRSVQADHRFRFDTFPSIKPLFQVPLPSLESVKLLPERLRAGQPRDASADYESWFDLGLSDELHPRLRRLETHRVVIPPPPISFSALRELVIDLESLRNPPLRPQDVVDVLAHSPRLETLKISASYIMNYPTEGSEHPTDIGPATKIRCWLPYLRMILLDCPYLFAAAILPAIDAPILAVFCVEVFNMDIQVDAAEFGPLLFPPSLRHMLQQHKQLFVAASGGAAFEIRDVVFLPSRTYRKDEEASNRLLLHVKDYTQDVVPLEVALYTLCSAFASASLQSLDVLGFKYAPLPDAWRALPTKFPALHSLRIRSPVGVMYSFFGALLQLSMQGEWPALRTVHINTSSFKYLGSLMLYNIFTFVLETARARAEREMPFTTLILEHEILTWAPIAAHRWMLYNISTLCKNFRLKSYGTVHNNYCRGLRDLFTVREWVRLLDDSWEETGTSDRAAEEATRTVDGNKLKNASDPDPETGRNDEDEGGDVDEDLPLFKSMILEELLKTVPRSA
ncbi:hypothetical protein LXA43DRAFT_135875 [Ganoderma leucocontextum]|nr:hypothetical protein LXA43DRAFT_135875 [Ganoderma leucocontextum]